MLTPPTAFECNAVRPIPAAIVVVRVHPNPIPFVAIGIGAPGATLCVFSLVRIEAVEDNLFRDIPAMSVCVSRLHLDL